MAQTGYRVLLKLTDARGKALPFGAMASSQTQQSIVDEGGVLYITGVNSQPQSWSVRWATSRINSANSPLACRKIPVAAPQSRMGVHYVNEEAVNKNHHYCRATGAIDDPSPRDLRSLLRKRQFQHKCNQRLDASRERRWNDAGIANPLTGSAYQIDCSCDAGTKVGLFYTVSSALSQKGKLSGYYHLNDNLDIKTEVDDIPGATAITPLNTKPIQESGSYSPVAAKAACAEPIRLTFAPPRDDRRKYPFYVVRHQTLSGELVIPDTLVAAVRAGWSTTTSFQPMSMMEDIAELRLQGALPCLRIAKSTRAT